MTPLTARQSQILEAIRAFIAEHRYAPTVRELGDIVGLESSSTTQYHLQNLQRLGYLTWQPKSNRTIVLVDVMRFDNGSTAATHKPDEPRGAHSPLVMFPVGAEERAEAAIMAHGHQEYTWNGEVVTKERWIELYVEHTPRS